MEFVWKHRRTARCRLTDGDHWHPADRQVEIIQELIVRRSRTMKATRKWIYSALALCAMAFSGATLAGPVILMGIDAEDGNGAGTGHGGKTPYVDVLESILDEVTNNIGGGLLVIGAGKRGR
jgi:hypothetical protein